MEDKSAPHQKGTPMTAALISFGSTILAILLVSVIRTEGRLSRVEGRLGHVEGRLDRVEDKLGQMDGRLDRVEDRLGQMDGSLGRVEAKLDIITAHLLPASQPVAAPQTDAGTAKASASETSQQVRSALL